MEKYEIVKFFEDFKKRISDIKDVLSLDNMYKLIEENEQKMLDSTFWDDSSNATKIVQETNDLKE